MRRLILMIVLALTVTAFTAGSAGSATSKSSYLIFSEATSAAGGGATIDTGLAGTFDAGAKTASGTGEYSSPAIGTGTFTLTRLITFQSYGCGFIEDTDLDDPTLCGGRVMFAVHFTPDTGAPFDGMIEVNCQIHGPSNHAPPGTSEGAKVNTRGINFNKHVEGDNVFIKT